MMSVFSAAALALWAMVAARVTSMATWSSDIDNSPAALATLWTLMEASSEARAATIACAPVSWTTWFIVPASASTLPAPVCTAPTTWRTVTSKAAISVRVRSRLWRCTCA